MILELIPIVANMVSGLISSEPATQEVVKTLIVDNPMTSLMITPGIIIELVCRIIPTKRRASILLALKWLINILKKVIRYAPTSLEWAEKGIEKLEEKIPQKVKK